MRKNKTLYISGLLIILAIFLVVLYLQYFDNNEIAQAQVFAGMQEVNEDSNQATIESMVATALATISPTVSGSANVMTEQVTQSQTTPDLVTPEAQSTLVVYNYPESFHIKGLIGHKQAYSLSCEAATAVDWAGYFDVDILEYDFQVALPHSETLTTALSVM